MVQYLDPQLQFQRRQTINVKSAASSRGAYGKPTYGTAEEIKARVIFQNDVVKTPSGEDETTTHQIIVTERILETDLIFLPGVATTDDALGKRPKQIQEGVGEYGTSDFWLIKV